MNNIFQSAKFGDKFQTRDGRMALFVSLICGKVAELIIEGEHFTRKFNLDGISCYGITNADIIGKWEESINEEQLDRLAIKAEKVTFLDTELPFQTKWVEGFKAGYRKAKGE